MHKHNFIILILASLLLSGTTFAQTAPAPVQYIVSPETPGPNQLVNIEVQGIGSFLGNAEITWQQNGKTILSGVGKKSYTFTTGGVGTQTRIHLVINSATQGVISRDFSFFPSVTNLVWEADTTTPPLYMGKPLYSAGSRLRVVAFPLVMSGGALVPSSKLSFQWTRNEQPQPEQSGLGANAFIFQGDQIQNSESVSVDVYLGTIKVGRGEIVVPASEPAIVVYAQDPLRGELLDEAIPESVSLGGKEVTLHAEPYFFSNESRRSGALSFAWTLNGREAQGPDSSRGYLTLRQTGTGTGAAQLSVSAQNTSSNSFVQSAKAVLQIIFGQQSSGSSLFGL